MKKIIQLFCILLTTSLFAQANFTEPTTTKKRTIVLDAGHGGADTGVKKDEFQEKDIVLKIANTIKERNPYQDIDFVFLRTGDEQIINTNRAKLINEIKPDLVLSLHANYDVKDSKKGTEIHISPMNPFFEQAKTLGEEIGNVITQEATQEVNKEEIIGSPTGEIQETQPKDTIEELPEGFPKEPIIEEQSDFDNDFII